MIISLLLFIPTLVLLGVALWNVAAWPQVRAEAASVREAALPPPPGSLSILIPARDEELNLAACLDTTLGQEGAAVAEVLIYDDHSSDRTAEISRDYMRRDARVRLVAPSALPDGWSGKNFACSQLAAEARGAWLLFLDADARLHTAGAARMLAEADARKLTLLSAWPALAQQSFAEQLLMPLLNFVVFTLYPAPLALKRRDASLGLAHGACLMVEHATYLRLGGHGAVRDEIFEDVRLAQTWRAAGERSLCLDGQSVVSVRMYRTLAEIWRGFQKNFFPASRSEATSWAFIMLHLAVCWLPFWLWPFVNGRASFMLIAVAACVLSMRLALALRFGHALWSVLLHPFGEMILIALGLSSWWRCRSGRGVEWKGRRYRTRR